MTSWHDALLDDLAERVAAKLRPLLEPQGSPPARDEWLKTAEIAEQYPLTPEWVYSAIHQGLPALREGKSYIVRRADLEAWLRRKAEEEAEERRPYRPVQTFRTRRRAA